MELDEVNLRNLGSFFMFVKETQGEKNPLLKDRSQAQSKKSHGTTYSKNILIFCLKRKIYQEVFKDFKEDRLFLNTARRKN